ncbi:hypothetical protein AB9P05_16475 [Roseivirga sp. BDSF3-8]|uniref:hypothetical protein n=1 Tax=Roseivirga sp. BDSF3-8 TaxID=3241598 RepID=UPI003531E769
MQVNLSFTFGLISLLFCFFFSPGCTSYQDEAKVKDTVTQEITPTLTNADTVDISSEPISESRVIEWNEFEQAIVEGTEPGFYIVETDEGFNYIKTDFDGDGIDDAIALLTFEGGPKTIMMIPLQP